MLEMALNLQEAIGRHSYEEILEECAICSCMDTSLSALIFYGM